MVFCRQKKRRSDKRDEEQQTNPFFVMVDSKTNEKFARSVNQKGLGQHGEVDWLIKTAVDELHAWGYNGGPAGHMGDGSVGGAKGDKAATKRRKARAW